MSDLPRGGRPTRSCVRRSVWTAMARSGFTHGGRSHGAERGDRRGSSLSRPRTRRDGAGGTAADRHGPWRDRARPQSTRYPRRRRSERLRRTASCTAIQTIAFRPPRKPSRVRCRRRRRPMVASSLPSKRIPPRSAGDTAARRRGSRPRGTLRSGSLSVIRRRRSGDASDGALAVAERGFVDAAAAR